MKKPESLGEKLWRSALQKRNIRNMFSRYRGVMLVLLIPVILILAVALLVPRKSPLHYDQAHSIKELRGHQVAGAARYAVVFDAGSTGSRVHVYRFDAGKSGDGELKLVSDTFEQLKPGLSAFADNPDKAAASLKPLIDTALRTVPKELQASTPLSLKATAGLRLLPGEQAANILAAVTADLKKTPFKMAPDAVGIMDGKDEGAFAWLTLNYLLGRLGKGPEATVAAIDLGGGSVQEAFAMSAEEVKAAPEGTTVPLKGGATEYAVYVHSYLGYGLMAGRAKVISASNGTAGHPCFAKSSEAVYKYGGKDYPITPSSSNPDFKQCATVSTEAMNVRAPCGAAVDQCTFDGVWRGKSRGSTPYYISSYFWDRAVESGIVSDSRALQWKTTPGDFAVKASDACGKPDISNLMKAYPGLKQDQAAFFCLDLSLCHQLLTAGFKLPPSQQITLVKQIEYNGQTIEASWALGAAINDLSRS